MINIISFIRANKNTPTNSLLSVVHSYDKKIITKSIHLALVELFRRHCSGLTEKRLIELMNFLNKKFRQLPSTSNVEINLSKIRQIIKARFGYDSSEYAKSQKHLVFDPVKKKENVQQYNAKVFERNENCKPIKVSLINKLLEYKSSDDYKKQIVYLLINSGSRFTELFNGVWNVDTENRGHVLLSNIAKTRDKQRVISKPLLDRDVTTFLSILNQNKNRNEDSTHSMVNKFLKQEISESTYFLRKAYCNYAYYLLNDQSIAKTTYLSRILGHEMNNESTATCYQGFYIEE